MKDIATYPCAVMVFLMVYDGIVTRATSHTPGSQWDKNLRPNSNWDETLHPNIQWDRTLQTDRPWNNTLQNDSQLEKTIHPDIQWGKNVYQDSYWGMTFYPESQWAKTRTSGSQWMRLPIQTANWTAPSSHKAYGKRLSIQTTVSQQTYHLQSQNLLCRLLSSQPYSLLADHASSLADSLPVSLPTIRLPVNQISSQPVNHISNQPTKHSMIQSINQSIFQSPSPSFAQSFNKTGIEKLWRTHQLSQTTWSVTLLSFNGIIFTLYADDTDAVFHVLQPNVLISFPHFDLQDSPGCQADKLTLFKVEHSQGEPEYTPLWSHCGERYIAPQVYSRHIAMRFTSDGSVSGTGFKMLYSFHPLSQVPQQLDAGLFNCSVPHYPTFQLHFHCNLETECVAGEDEAHCPYTSTDCGAGNIDVRNKCYRYVTVRRQITWYDAEELCRSHGERLVILRSFIVIANFISKVLKFIRNTHHVLVGTNTYTSEMLSFIPPAMSHSYYMSTLSNTSHNLNCANVDTFSKTPKQYLISCDAYIFVHFVICERDVDTTSTAFDNGGAVIKEAQSHVYHVDLSVCNNSNQYIPVWDGTVVEANLVMKKPVSFKCFICVLANEGQYVTTVIETFRLVNVLDVETVEPILNVVDGGKKRQYQESVDSVLLHSVRYEEGDFAHPRAIASASNVICYLLRPFYVTHVYLRLRVLVTDLPGTMLLLHVKTQPHEGYVTSFAFDGQTGYARKTITGIASLQLRDYGITFSFRHFDLGLTCQGETGKLVLRTLKGWGLLLKCGRQDIHPLIYTVPVQLSFSTGSSISHSTGFKMLYSIHPVSEVPQQLDSGLFNCSVPHYPTFQLHFHCNLETECVAGEDEAHCPYISMDCRAGDIDAGNKCYRYVTVRRQITWYDADELCRGHGERLVSPLTPTEWDAFRTIIGYGKKSIGVFVGLSTSPSTLHSMYKDVWRWADQTMAFYVNARGGKTSKPTCAHVPPVYTDVLQPIPCDVPIYVRYVLCERDKVSNQDRHTLQVPDDPLTAWTSKQTVVRCPNGHLTHDFLSCDLYADCGVTNYVSSYPLIGTDGVPLFSCDGGVQTLHYTLVCDHRQDCSDGLDETWCVHDACLESHVKCKNQQCVRWEQWCDGMKHCQDGSDEECPQYVPAVAPSLPPPAVVSLDGHGGYTIRELGPAKPCPVTHFRCSQHDYCLPVYLRCNGVYDCMGCEDEAECGSYTCPGLYRCRASSVCVHSEHMCDGVFQCPQQDDEWLCDASCPQGCRCQGLAFICNQTFEARFFTDIRYLDAGGSGMTPHDLGAMHYLVRLSLSQCGLTTVANMTFPNLRWLDLSANALTRVNMQTFVALRNLRVLRLAANPLTSLLPSRSDGQHINLHTLDLSGTQLVTYNGRILAGFPRLMCLNFSHGALSTITEEGFNSTPSVRVLDVRGSPLDDFPHQLLRQLAAIDTVFASNFKLCCPAALPGGFNTNNCHAPMDEIVSCDNLLRSNAYRVFLWLMAAMAITGNAGGLAARVLQGEVSKTGFHVFVTNLCLADLLMGVYLIVIGGADLLYRGHYLWNDKLWRGSVACQVAGFLSLLSNEVSAFFICLITLDRFLALRFPLRDIRFHKDSALAACAVAWTGGFLLALVPLTSDWAFYSQTGICIPLPITRATFGGSHYSFGVLIVLNFVLFVLIALGQVLVFLSVRKNSIEGTRGEQDLTIARRLTTIVLSDFLCWFPIGLLGLLAATGTPISSELNVGAAIFVLPFNSALNPFLYTISVVMEKRRKAAEARLLKLLMQRVGFLGLGRYRQFHCSLPADKTR